jgi:hypothetical protein
LPQVVRAAVDGDILRIYYRTAVPLTDAAGYIPDRSSFAVSVNGAAAIVDGRSVLVALKAVQLDLRTAVAAGATVSVSYTPPATGFLATQDLAGNKAAGFTAQAVNNTTGMPDPTKTVAITSIGGAAPGGYTSDTTPVIQGTVSAALADYEEVEVRRVFVSDTGVTSYVLVGSADVTGTSWSLEEVDRGDRFFAWAARVRNGDKFGPFSAVVGITVDSKPPQVPVIGAGQAVYRVGESVTIFGGWGAGAGESLVVYINGEQRTTANGVQVNGRTWTLPLGPLPAGRYNLGVIVTDRAGNTADTEEGVFFDVINNPSINEWRLALARRAV